MSPQAIFERFKAQQQMIERLRTALKDAKEGKGGLWRNGGEMIIMVVRRSDDFFGGGGGALYIVQSLLWRKCTRRWICIEMQVELPWIKSGWAYESLSDSHCPVQSQCQRDGTVCHGVIMCRL